MTFVRPSPETLRTERLVLEPLAPEHAEGLYRALDDDRVGEFIGGPDVTTLDDLRSRISMLARGAPAGRHETWLNFAVLLGDEIIGRIEATVHDGVAEIAYLLGPQWWGRGFATEAVVALLRHLGDAGVPEAWATIHPDNSRSVALLERVGFERTGVPVTLRLLSYDDGDVVMHREIRVTKASRTDATPDAYPGS